MKKKFLFRRRSKDVRDLNEVLSIQDVLRLKPVAFRWISDGTEDIGFIAEDTGDVSPRLTTTDLSGTPTRIRYLGLTASTLMLTQFMFERQERIIKSLSELVELNSKCTCNLSDSDESSDEDVTYARTVVCEIPPYRD